MLTMWGEWTHRSWYPPDLICVLKINGFGRRLKSG
nr:MAG TPA: hypothetical protein [Bacteriophage sp.]